MKGFCDICGTEIEVRMCCSGHECGCMGLPIDPPVCSSECYDKFMDKQKNIKHSHTIGFNLKKYYICTIIELSKSSGKTEGTRFP